MNIQCVKCGRKMSPIFVKVLDKYYRYYQCKFCLFETKPVRLQEESWQSERKGNQGKSK